jgi:hypothetical protein
MSVSRGQAGADLAAIEDVAARVRQSRIYRVSSDIVILWGFVQMLQYGVINLLPPGRYPWSWVAVDMIGVVATVFLLRRVGKANPLTTGRILGTYLLFYGFGFLWSSVLGPFDGRAVAVFWHTLFLFGMSVAGLWFGWGFLVIGLGLSAALLLIFLHAGAAFWPLVALVSGCGYIATGLWMRRA